MNLDFYKRIITLCLAISLTFNHSATLNNYHSTAPIRWLPIPAGLFGACIGATLGCIIAENNKKESAQLNNPKNTHEKIQQFIAKYRVPIYATVGAAVGFCGGSITGLNTQINNRKEEIRELFRNKKNVIRNKLYPVLTIEDKDQLENEVDHIELLNRAKFQNAYTSYDKYTQLRDQINTQIDDLINNKIAQRAQLNRQEQQREQERQAQQKRESDEFWANWRREAEDQGRKARKSQGPIEQILNYNAKKRFDNKHTEYVGKIHSTYFMDFQQYYWNHKDNIDRHNIDAELKKFQDFIDGLLKKHTNNQSNTNYNQKKNNQQQYGFQRSYWDSSDSDSEESTNYNNSQTLPTAPDPEEALKIYATTLGLDFNDLKISTKEDAYSKIKKSYNNLSRKLHPDRNIGKSATEKKDAEEEFKKVNDAYKQLKNHYGFN